MVETYPVVIIGGGPAGLAAAMQLSRQGHKSLLLEKDRVGGLLWNANLVENYPGFPAGIRGPELVALFKEQAQRLDVKIARDEALEIGFDGKNFRIGTRTGELTAAVIVMATGTVPRKLPEHLMSSEIADRIFSEVYPLLGSQGKEVVIIGGGDAAFDYALNLARANQVMVLTRGKEIQSLPLLVDRAQDHPSITCRLGVEVLAVHPGHKSGLEIKVVENGREGTLAGDYLIAAIGREPARSLLSPSIMNGIEQLQEEHRFFQIGDLKNGLYRQTTIAVGDGIRAAMEIDHYLHKDKL